MQSLGLVLPLKKCEVSCLETWEVSDTMGSGPMEAEYQKEPDPLCAQTSYSTGHHQGSSILQISSGLST